MFDYILSLNPIWQALLATIFTWSITAIGAALVYFFKKINKNLMDGMLGFAAGVMIAASFFSLIAPAITMSESLNLIPWLVVFIGFFSGGLLLFIGDKIYDIYEKKSPNKKSSFKRSIMLVSSITLHNIPEGMAVGVAFGSVIYGLEGATLAAAWTLALGIGLQNFPEGTAVSMPLRRDGMSRNKAFFVGQISGIVEPIAGVIGAILVMKVRILLPFLLAFAAGAMIYVVVEELVPESQSNKKKDLMALFTLIGFSIMMILDIALG
ncbi:MAG: ZIP family metal transporter [Bacilli bacterium]|nr:ZIP family metal transporter [Bacilli bacterium]